jgi:hypothetical protein
MPKRRTTRATVSFVLNDRRPAGVHISADTR